MMRINSFAKINLGVEVLRRRDDGYHEIRTLFQSVSLHDEIEFLETGEGSIQLRGSDNSISWGEDNLIFQAAALLQRRFRSSRGAIIRVAKNIPAGHGLGGGSSNAAMTLWALNKLWNLRRSQQELMDLGAALGADVPYFLVGGFCLGTGIGEHVHKLPELSIPSALLILPGVNVSTARIYANHRVSLTSGGKDSKISRFLKDPQGLDFDNDLEETVFRLYPSLRDIKNRLLSVNPQLSRVSGSGSAVFGLFSDRAAAKEAFDELRTRYEVRLIDILSRERYWEMVRAGV